MPKEELILAIKNKKETNMFVTSNYKKIKKGEFQYSFFLNNRDSLENKIEFVQELNILIERFSRDLDDKGLIVKSYDSDIEKVRKEILDKPWNYRRLETIKKTPGILMIDTEFDVFNPNKDNWLYFYFIRDQRFRKNRGNSFTIGEAEELFDKLAELISRNEANIFKEIKKMLIHQKSERLRDVVIEELVSYGIGISADKLLNIIKKIL
jgi:hypothetical protein